MLETALLSAARPEGRQLLDHRATGPFLARLRASAWQAPCYRREGCPGASSELGYRGMSSPSAFSLRPECFIQAPSSPSCSLAAGAMPDGNQTRASPPAASHQPLGGGSNGGGGGTTQARLALILSIFTVIQLTALWFRLSRPPPAARHAPPAVGRATRGEAAADGGSAALPFPAVC